MRELHEQPTTGALTEDEQERLGNDWRTFKRHRPVGQMDGDCRECHEAWPCSTVQNALLAARTQPALDAIVVSPGAFITDWTDHPADASTEAVALLDRAAQRIARILTDERVRPFGSDSIYLAAHDAQNDLARARAALASDKAAAKAEALREAADEFEAEQRQKTRERQELHVWSVACKWLRDRADRVERDA